MAGWLELDIQPGQLELLAAELDATEAQIQKALASTFTRLARWVRTRATRGLSGDLKVPQKIIRRRIKFAMRRRRDGFKIWFGLDPVGLHEMKPRQTATGVTAGKHKRPGAFLAQGIGGGEPLVFRREGEKRIMTRGRYKGRLRQPIKRESLDIKEGADRFIEDQILNSTEFSEQFWKIFERELSWRTQTQK